MTFGRAVLAAAAITMIVSSNGASVAADQPGVAPATAFHGKALFNGTSFDGWEGDHASFRIVHGAIVGGSLVNPIPRNEFLATTRSYGDFELRVKLKLTDGKGNGGVQFRSQRVPGSREMSGYQADAADTYWGGLWDESRRKMFLGTRLNEAAMKKALKPNDWNAYVIRAEGPRIRLWLNGVLTLDYVEPYAAIPRTGYIGVQIHVGAPSEASYKDLEIEELK